MSRVIIPPDGGVKYRVWGSKKVSMQSFVLNKRWEDVLPKYPDGYWDLANCDIPYGINVGKMAFLSEVGTSVKQKNGSRLNPHKNKKTHKNKEWDQQVPDQAYFDELRRVSKHQIIFGVGYVNWEGLGTGRIKWDKGVAEGVSFSRYETAYCSLIDDTWELPLLWSGMCQAKSISEPMVQQGNKSLNEKRIHFCQKPVLLYDTIYRRFGFEGMKVLDTHTGSGSNRISCDKLGYDFLGCEADEDHFNDAENRYKEFKKQLRMF